MEKEKLESMLRDMAKQTEEYVRPTLSDDIKRRIPHPLLVDPLPHRRRSDLGAAGLSLAARPRRGHRLGVLRTRVERFRQPFRHAERPVGTVPEFKDFRII